MVWSFGTVTLPYGPSKVQRNKSANKEQICQSGDDPIQIVDGFKDNNVSLTGTIADSTKTAAELVSTYIDPLLAIVGSEITVVSTDGSCSGTWLLDDFQPSKETAANLWRYSMRLSKGKANYTFG
jgi:hypothetical protein